MSLPIYYAPLEGVTDAVYRRVHRAHFSGVEKYFIPFVSPTQDLCFTPRERRNIDPQYNEGVPVVPQVLTKRADYFLWAAQELCDRGYTEVNLNIGCPSGTVTGKGKGAGMLTDLFALEQFLDEIFAHSPLPVSIKTRIGFFNPEEFGDLIDLFNRYPIHELTIHPRTRAEQYTGRAHRDAYLSAAPQMRMPLVYNGDLFLPEHCRSLEEASPQTRALMLGRGLLANPALAQTLKGGTPLSRETFFAFHDALLEAFFDVYPKNVVHGRMREFMKYAICCFDHPEKPRKALRKAGNLHAYEAVIEQLRECHPLRENPGYVPEDQSTTNAPH